MRDTSVIRCGPAPRRKQPITSRALGVSDSLVGEKGQVVDAPDADEAHRFLVAGFAEDTLACPEDDRVDHQAQLVNQVVLQERVPELEAGGDNDFPVYLLLQLRDFVYHVPLQYRRVVPHRRFEGRGHDVLGQAVQPLRQRATSGWPPGGQELVAPTAQQKGFGAQRLVERHLRRLFATLAAYATNPATKPEALDAGRVLDYSVERDVFADNDLSDFGSPFRWR